MSPGFRSFSARALLAMTLLSLAFQNCAPAGGSSGAVQTSTVPPQPISTSRPSAPSHLTATSAAATQVNLAWSDGSTNEAGFKIERAVSNAGPFSIGSGPGPFTLVTTAAANATSYIDAAVLPSTLYYYRVTATNSSGDSAPTSTVSVTTPAPPSTAPVAPSNAVAVATAATLISFTWLDNSNNESNFYVERSSDGGATFTTAAVLSSGLTRYDDFNLIPQTSYVYRVRASNSIGNSAYATSAAATTMAAGNKATYAYLSVNVIGPNCATCHGTNNPAAGISLATYAQVSGHLTPNNSANSQIIRAIMTGGMPPIGPMTADQINSLKQWIDGGATNN